MAIDCNKKFKMCRFNAECASRDGQCNCERDHKVGNNINVRLEFPQLAHLPHPYLPSPLLCSQNLILMIYRTVQQSSELIKTLSDSAGAASDKLDSIISKLDAMPRSAIEAKPADVFVPIGDFTSARRLQDILCKGRNDFKYRIKLVSVIPEPAYKERAFEISAMITDLQGNSAVLPKSTNFKVLLFTTESPPKLLRLNTSGDKIMRGTIEQESSSEIHFPKVVIKEVTSHFRNGCVFLVIASTEETDIQPLIVDSFIIKARKMNGENEPRKKMKYDYNSSD